MPNSCRFDLQAAIRGVVCVTICTLTLVACAPGVTKDTSAENLLPNLPDYEVSDTTNIQDAIAKVAGGAALVAGQPDQCLLNQTPVEASGRRFYDAGVPGRRVRQHAGGRPVPLQCGKRSARFEGRIRGDYLTR